MLAAFLTGGKQAFVSAKIAMGGDPGRLFNSGKSRALPVHHEGDPRVLLRIEAQRIR